MSQPAYQISRGAYDYAVAQGLPQMARVGGGQEFIDSMIRARTAALRPKLAQARFDAQYSVLQRLGEHTQTGQSGTARAAVEAYGFGQYTDSIMAAEQENESMRQSASNAWLNILTDVDSRRDQAVSMQRQIDASRGNWFDRALGVAALFV